MNIEPGALFDDVPARGGEALVVARHAGLGEGGADGGGGADGVEGTPGGEGYAEVVVVVVVGGGGGGGVGGAGDS